MPYLKNSQSKQNARYMFRKIDAHILHIKSLFSMSIFVKVSNCFKRQIAARKFIFVIYLNQEGSSKEHKMYACFVRCIHCTEIFD